MKRFVLEFGAGRPEAVKGKAQRPADKMKMAEALARMVDKNLLDAVAAAGKTLDSYVDSLEISTRQATFDCMSTDEKLAEIANLIEN